MWNLDQETNSKMGSHSTSPQIKQNWLNKVQRKKRFASWIELCIPMQIYPIWEGNCLALASSFVHLPKHQLAVWRRKWRVWNFGVKRHCPIRYAVSLWMQAPLLLQPQRRRELGILDNAARDALWVRCYMYRTFYSPF